MELLVHVVIGLASVAYSTYLIFSPSKSKIAASYVLIALTFATGFYLIILNPAVMLRVCVSGLAYSGIIAVLQTFAYRRLAKLALR